MCAKELIEGVEHNNWQMWSQRFDALEMMLGTLVEQVEKGTDVPRQATFSVMLSNLQSFAAEQFEYLYEGHKPDSKERYRLEPSLAYSADFVLGGTLDQVSFDLTVIQEAWYQRMLARDDEATSRTLEVADQLAYYALLPAVWRGLLPYKEEEVTVLTYFQKQPTIRVIPYACVALVGIPFTALATYKAGEASATGNARDLLAIPHEIGHYVYQHGLAHNRRLKYELFDALRGKPDWLLNWAEEIFADVYGCFIAGPVIVRDFQELMLDNEASTFLEDDGEHPTPVLRPLIYCDALRILAERVEDVDERSRLEAFAVEAEERWREERGNRGDEHIAERRPIIKATIKATYDNLIQREAVSSGSLWSVLDSEAAPAAQYKDLYARFYEDVVAEDGLFQRLERYAPATDDGEKGESAEPRRPPELDDAWQTPEHRLPTLRSLKRIRNDRPKGAASGEAAAYEEKTPAGEGAAVEPESADDYEVVPAEVWTLVASMHGWATKGPEDNPNPKFGG